MLTLSNAAVLTVTNIPSFARSIQMPPRIGTSNGNRGLTWKVIIEEQGFTVRLSIFLPSAPYYALVASLLPGRTITLSSRPANLNQNPVESTVLTPSLCEHARGHLLQT